MSWKINFPHTTEKYEEENRDDNREEAKKKVYHRLELQTLESSRESESTGDDFMIRALVVLLWRITIMEF